MKLILSQIQSITTGAARIEEAANGFHFYRFTRQQEELYRNRSEDFYGKTFSTAGIRMRFRTNSQRLFFHVDTARGSSRSYFCFEVFVNGKKTDELKNFNESELTGDYSVTKCELGEFSKTFCLGTGEKEVCICFPWSVQATVKEMSLDDGSKIEPAKPVQKLLCFGDSITHGYDALYPSNRYPSRLADLLNAQEHCKAIGGEIFSPELASAREDFQPDYITVAYGTNDWNRCDREELTHNCRAFFANLCANYPNVPVLVITPIWRKNLHESKPCGAFESVDALIREQAAAFGNITVVNGFSFVPQDTSLFADGWLHPNDQGFAHYFASLSQHIK